MEMLCHRRDRRASASTAKRLLLALRDSIAIARPRPALALEDLRRFITHRDSRDGEVHPRDWNRRLLHEDAIFHG